MASRKRRYKRKQRQYERRRVKATSWRFPRGLDMDRYPKTLSYGERLMKHMLDATFPNEPFKDNYRPDWLKNPTTGWNLEIDRYYSGLKLGFEFQGAQHLKQVNINQWRRDRRKRALARENADKLRHIVNVYPQDMRSYFGFMCLMSRTLGDDFKQLKAVAVLDAELIEFLERKAQKYFEQTRKFYEKTGVSDKYRLSKSPAEPLPNAKRKRPYRAGYTGSGAMSSRQKPKELAEGQPCRTCGASIYRVDKDAPPEKRKGRDYWFQWYYRCPNQRCNKTYHVEAAKRFYDEPEPHVANDAPNYLSYE